MILAARLMAGELVGVLHCSELHDDSCGGPELDPVRGERFEARDGDVVCLEGDGRLRQLSEAGADPGKQVTLRLDDLDAAERGRRVDVPAVRGEDEAVSGDDERGVRALEPRQIPEVDRLRDEEARRAEALQLGPQTGDALVQPCSFR